MKKSILIFAAAILMSSCSMLQKSTGSNASTTAGTSTQATAGTNATTAGQGAGNALLALYNQYKADGNKYDYQNMQNILNTVTLVANCEGLKNNFSDKTYRSEFGKGMIASSLGLVTQDNVEAVTNSLADMVKNSETVQTVKTQTQSTASTAASYANTAAQYAGALGTLLSAFSNK